MLIIGEKHRPDLISGIDKSEGEIDGGIDDPADEDQGPRPDFVHGPAGEQITAALDEMKNTPQER